MAGTHTHTQIHTFTVIKSLAGTFSGIKIGYTLLSII